MEQLYPDVIRCALSSTERRVWIEEATTPLVIKPQKSASASFLRGFLYRNSSQILQDISQHGALLIRGFEIESAAEFEEQILSIQGMRGIQEVLFSEPGRSLIDGTQGVFTTNSLVKTGGTLAFGMFHSENYFTPEVPRYISFFCKKRSALGGETGIVNTAKVYADLPDATKQKLEERACLVYLVPLTEIVSRYRVSASRSIEFLRSVSLPLVTINGASHVAIYKPSVIEHPITQERTLTIAFAYVDGLQKTIVNAFLSDYRGLPWLLHRLSWKFRWVDFVYGSLLARSINLRIKAAGTIYTTKASTPLTDARTLSAVFSDEEVGSLAVLMRRHYSSFLWNPGDILIVDNLKMAHNGMAGFGDRELLVMLCNPVLLSTSADGSGLQTEINSRERSLVSQLTQVDAPQRSRSGASATVS